MAAYFNRFELNLSDLMDELYFFSDLSEGAW